MENRDALVAIQRHIDKMEKEVRRLGSMKVRQFNALFGLAGSGHVIIGVGGIQVMQGTTVMGEWQTDGDIFIGSDIAVPASTYFSILAQAQNYNGEAFSAGDMLIGDNSAAKANIFWDKSAGRLNFRGGTTTQVYIDTDGSLKAGAGAVILDTDGLTIFSGTVDYNIIKFTNGSNFKTLKIYSNEFGAITQGWIWSEASGGVFVDANINLVAVSDDDTQGIITLYSSDGGNTICTITSQQIVFAGNLTVNDSAIFNESGNDVDFRVESDTQTHSLFVQGFDGFVGINNNAPSSQLDVVGSAEITLGLNVGSASAAATGEARASVGFSARVDGSGGGLYAGALSDVQFYRGGANLWQTPDSLTVDANLVATVLNLPPQAVTIASGTFARTGSWMVVDTEGAAASDDLDTVSGGVSGDILILSSTNNTRDVVVKYSTAANGFRTNGSADFTLSLVQDKIVFLFNGTYWNEIGRGDNG